MRGHPAEHRLVGGARRVVVAPDEDVGDAERADAREDAGRLALGHRAEVHEVAGVDDEVDALGLDDRAHQRVLVATVDVADEEHAQGRVGLERAAGVLLLQRRRQREDVPQVGRHLAGPGLDVAEEALVALERAEHLGGPVRPRPARLVRGVHRRGGAEGRHRPRDDGGHDEGLRGPSAPGEPPRPEHDEDGEQGPEGEALDDAEGDVADGGVELLRARGAGWRG